MLLSNRNDRTARGLLALLFLAAFLLVAPTQAVFASGPAPIAGQPNQNCEMVGVTPGNAASASGSAFNPDGLAGTKYAGSQPQNSNNPFSVSQYDVACYQVSLH